MDRLAAIQMASGPRVDANLAEAERLVAHAARAGARLVALPENFALMALNDADRLAAAEEEGDGPIQDCLSRLARQHGIWLVGGTLPLKTAGATRVRAACLVYDPDGRRAARYDKMHLFDVRLGNGEEYRESNSIEPGGEAVVVETPCGRLGLAICYDLRFPELFRELLAKGAELYAVPSAFTAVTGRAHWETLVRARAIENLAYVLAPDQGGRHANGRETHGETLIVNPWGEVLDRVPKGAGIAIADLDLDYLREARERLPSIHHRRIKA
ncbi:apolipoprotein acyltransferase [Sulfurifustis variabilis]|uniref:Apolipoprotein acyltransferase n=1 Tax=Sulfurifustis variabilis TaxID=1675686 RepID=A0A1B4V152_9GAMM|nr:carbon-nitrogen hydrolase family protein [Sulfurifustis variabilis]BAU47190.1 apolipoprotein acyltransferase [Sulfurifustis variabilis]